MNQNRLLKVAQDPALSPCALRLLMVLMADLDGGNVFRLSQGECGKILGYTRRQINRAWKQLREAGIVEEGFDRGVPAWVLAPELAWRGKARELRGALQSRQDARLAGVKAAE